MAANSATFQRIHNLPKRMVSISNTLLQNNSSSFSERSTALTVPVLADGRNGRPYKKLYHQKQKNKRRIGGLITIKAKKDGKSSNWGGRTPPPFANGSPGGTDCPVPFDQQPVNEYQSLTNSDFFSWANEDIWKYGLRLGGIGTAFTVLIGWPVASVSVDPEHELLKCGIGALCGGLLVVTLAALRLYLGWAYVGNRLLSATVEYEETGWYDGEVWVKPPEVLARDRLLGSYSVKPILNRVKITLISLAMSLFVSILIFITLKSPNISSSSLPVEVDEPFGQRSYDDGSARLFEPEAFNSKDKESQLDDYCH